MQLIESIFNNVINEWEISRLPHNGWLEHPDVNGAKTVIFDLQAGEKRQQNCDEQHTHQPNDHLN